MFEKFRQFLDDGKSMLEDAFVIPDDDDFVAVPPGVTEEQLIEEAKQYVDAIIVEPHHEQHQNLVGVDLGSDQQHTPEQNHDPAPDAAEQNHDPAPDAAEQNPDPAPDEQTSDHAPDEQMITDGAEPNPDPAPDESTETSTN